MITVGSKLRLKNAGSVYEVVDFGFEIHKETGNYWAFMTTSHPVEGNVKQAVWMIVEMLNSGLFKLEK